MTLPAYSERDRRWWSVPLWTLLGLIPIGFADIVTIGLATMATGNCETGSPCPAEDQISAHLVGAFLTAVVLLIGTVAVPWRTSLRGLRGTLGVLTLLAAAWPILWVFVFGGPET